MPALDNRSELLGSLSRVTTSDINQSAVKRFIDLLDAQFQLLVDRIVALETAPGTPAELILEMVVPSGSPVALATGDAINVAWIDLTLGSWIVSGVVAINGTGSTNFTLMSAALNSVSSTSPSIDLLLSTRLPFVVTPSAGVHTMIPVGPVEVSVSVTTRIYLLALANFTASTASAYGRITGRRMSLP